MGRPGQCAAFDIATVGHDPKSIKVGCGLSSRTWAFSCSSGQEEGRSSQPDEAADVFALCRRQWRSSKWRTLLSGDYDEREALVTIRSEAGGVDAADFAAMLLRMYLRWAETPSLFNRGI